MMQFSIEYGDPTDPTEIDCQADGYALLDGYYPESSSDPEQPVMDNARLLIQAESAENLSVKIGALNLAFDHARRHKTGPLGCYLNFAPDGTLDPWRTRITGGLTTLDAGLSKRWKQKKAVVGLVVERAAWWEGQEDQAPLTNRNGTANTNGLTVHNHYDGGHDNFVDIDATDVAGDLNAATRLELTNNFATNRLYDVWIGQNWTTPSSFSHILEGESASGGSSPADSNSSGGYYRSNTLSGSGEITLYTWSLDSNYLSACRGRFFKMLARFWDGNATFLSNLWRCRFKFQVIYQATVIWESGWTSINPSRYTLIRDLATMKMPPWLPYETGLSGVSLALVGSQDAGPFVAGLDLTAGLDFLQVTPVDGWRYLTCAGYGVAQNGRIIDDGINSVVYADDGSGDDKLGILVPYAAPIVLKPAAAQRLYFLAHSNLANTAEILRTMSVKLFYRPRRMNV